jgi:lipoprotein-releasing system permease protein
MKLAIYLGTRAIQASLRTTVIVTGSITLAVGVVLVMSSLLFGFRGEFIGKTVNASAHVRITTEASTQKDQPAYLLNRWGLRSVDNVKPPDLPDKIRGSQEIIASIRTSPEVVAISPSISSNVILRYGAISYPATLLGILPDEENKVTGLYDKVVEGNAGELKTQDKGMAIGRTIAQKLGVEVGNTLRLTARDGTSHLFRIVAVISTGVSSLDSSRLWVNLKDAQTVAGQYSEITEIGIKIRDYEKAEEFAARLSRSFDYRVEPWQETNANILDLLVIIFANIFFVLGGLILAAGFGIFNVFAMSVLDRQRDIAILRTMGVRQETLVKSFLVQGIVVGIVGGLAGLIIGQFFIDWLASLTFSTASDQRPVSGNGFTMLEAWWLYLSAFGLGLSLAVGSAVLPAYRAGKINPVDVIRGG